MITTRTHARKTRSFGSAARTVAVIVGAGAAAAACGTAAHSAATSHPVSRPATHLAAVQPSAATPSVHVVSSPAAPPAAAQASQTAPPAANPPVVNASPTSCMDTQLRETFPTRYMDAAMGSRFALLQVENVSTTACYLAGPSFFALLGSGNQPLHNNIDWPANPVLGKTLLPAGASQYMTVQYAPVNLGPGGPETGCSTLYAVQTSISASEGVGGGIIVPFGPTQICGSVIITSLRSTPYGS